MIINQPDTLIINEIFYSIQGESSKMGLPCVFVRLTYCNIRCSYCDSEYAFYEGKEMQLFEIITEIKNYGCSLVEITGGEPLFQANVHPLMKQLCDDGFEVLLETGGSIDINAVDVRVKRIVDFKCPSSAMMKKNIWKNCEYLNPSDEVKFVIGNREDYEWAKEKIAEFDLQKKCAVLMSVTFGTLNNVQLAEWILEDKLRVRMQLQLHKYIWDPHKRGV